MVGAKSTDGTFDVISARHRASRLGFALAAAAALLAILALRPLWPNHRSSVDPQKSVARARALGDRHGILIGFGAPDTFFVPPYHPTDARIVNGVATSVDMAALPPALDGIEQSLAIYPPGFVAQHCKAIFICGSLMLGGAAAGGTYGPAWIILVATQKVGETGIFETARLGVHHELSSLVWNANPRLRTRWAAELPSDWRPAASPAEELAAAHPEVEREMLEDSRRDGFLSAYGATSIENDFNVYAETIFTDANRVPRLAKSQPRVARKAGLLMAAYIDLDASFVALFVRLGLGDLQPARLNSADEGMTVSPMAIPSGHIVRPERH
jgi:hypothetical protein